MRIVFMATGGIALPSFRYLLAHGPLPLALVTQPDKPVGRRQALVPSEIKSAALAAGIPVLQPERTSDALPELAALAPDVIVVMAYGQILRKNIIELPRIAIINLHASLLPKYRGASCIQAAIAAGDRESGISVIHVVREVDAGDLILAGSLPLADDETGGRLHDRLADLAPRVLADSLAALENGRAPRHPQDPAAASHAPKLGRDDGRIDWTMEAAALERLVRAYDPWPGTFTVLAEDAGEKRVKIFPPVEVVDAGLRPGEVATDDGGIRIGCGIGALRITSVQPEGGRKMTAAEYLRGHTPRQAR